MDFGLGPRRHKEHMVSKPHVSKTVVYTGSGTFSACRKPTPCALRHHLSQATSGARQGLPAEGRSAWKLARTVPRTSNLGPFGYGFCWKHVYLGTEHGKPLRTCWLQVSSGCCCWGKCRRRWLVASCSPVHGFIDTDKLARGAPNGPSTQL